MLKLTAKGLNSVAEWKPLSATEKSLFFPAVVISFPAVGKIFYLNLTYKKKVDTYLPPTQLLC